MITIDDFQKVEITVGEVLTAEKVPDTDKLLRLVVDFGQEKRQVISGIAEYFPDPGALVGKRCPFVTNLEPRVIRGLESQAMILATDSMASTSSPQAGSPQAGETPQLFLFETKALPGARVR